MSSEISAIGASRSPSRGPSHPILGVILALVASSLLGGFWFCVAWAQRAGTPSNAVGVGLHILCVTALTVTVTASGRWNGVWRGLRDHRGLYLSICALGAVLSVVSVNGLGMSSLGSLGILSSTDILFTVLLGALIFREKIRWASLVALLAILIGAGMRIVGGQAEVASEKARTAAALPLPADASPKAPNAAPGDSPLSVGVRRLIGDAMFLVYAFLLSLNAFLIKRMLKHSSWQVILFGNMTARLTLFVIIAAVTGQAAQGIRIFSEQPLTLWAVAGAGAILSLQMSLYYQALRLIPVWVAKTFMMTMPVFYFAVEWVGFGKEPGWDVWFGALLVLCGALSILITDPIFRRQVE